MAIAILIRHELFHFLLKSLLQHIYICRNFLRRIIFGSKNFNTIYLLNFIDGTKKIKYLFVCGASVPEASVVRRETSLGLALLRQECHKCTECFVPNGVVLPDVVLILRK